VAIGSDTTTLVLEDVVASLLSEEMRRKNMERSTKDSLVVRGRSVDRDKGKFSGRKSKLKGRSKSPVQSTRRCWKCGKVRHYKRDCKSKAMEVSTGFNEKNSTERKTTPDMGGDVYLASTSTQSDQNVWLIDLGASYHMTPHREWFCEYERYEGGDVFLVLDYVARACTSTLGVSSSVEGAHFISRQHYIGGDHLTQRDIKS
jgi:hypothetical protein